MAGERLERTVKHAVILVKTCLAAVVNWKMYSYFRSFTPIFRADGDLPAYFPVISTKFAFFLNITAYFTVSIGAARGAKDSKTPRAV
jgi:hypothetical protein